MTASRGPERRQRGFKEALVRFSVAIGGDLLDAFDRYRTAHRYPNRSEAVRGLIRTALIEEAVAADDQEVMGVVTLVYDHHVGHVAERLTELQHQHLAQVVTTTHVHLDTARCLEVILLRGPTRLVRTLADGLIGTRGVETGRLVLAAAHAIGQSHPSGDPAPQHHHHHHHPHHHPAAPGPDPAVDPT